MVQRKTVIKIYIAGSYHPVDLHRTDPRYLRFPQDGAANLLHLTLSGTTCPGSLSFAACVALKKLQQQLAYPDIFFQVTAVTMQIFHVIGLKKQCVSTKTLTTVNHLPDCCKDCKLRFAVLSYPISSLE